MIGNPGSLLLIAGVFLLGTNKLIPKWLAFVLVIPLALLIYVTANIELIVAKIFFKYETDFINSDDTKKSREARRVWLTEHIGDKNFITMGFSIDKNKRKLEGKSKYDLLEVERYICFKTEEQAIHYKIVWSGAENNE